MTTDLPARMLRLLSLLQTRREWSGTELAERLGVTTRTIRRDIDRLRGLGYPVEGTTGHAGGYRLASGAAMPPLILDDEEAIATAVALRTAAGHLTGMEETSLRALAKLERILPARLRAQVAALHQATDTIGWEDRGPRVDPAALTTLATACRDHETVTFDYTTRDGTAARRRADPHHLVASAGLWYLLAHDTGRDDWRVYRLDRITDPVPTRHRFTPRPVPGHDPADYVAQKIATAPARYRALATVHAPADTIRHRTGALPARVQPLDDTTCTVDCSSDSLAHIAQALTALNADYALDADPDVTNYLHHTTERTRRALGT
ncbi:MULTISPECIES: helix-turn-helix transcriptional regulator [Streptomycetaceae]|uniref:Putative transcriptional regulator n=1 Tax=Streptantibioticus cattleyicolor (strain ATCC 35852 / DSM 46488 / JCM 4925 / NBRC 14057 / NRRL 8057) TaxID=1003195 RepID=F8JU02_STREN|nr:MULTISPECIES: YafY family protein [Streptomycetaceae]AEW98104.1 putative transcriptional regulator [Streptantibioticus cattleyicolor NRRL 8057 = DSM 46488]MYS62496.1 WYL domain-containing protein [Streptomyces sp. SID5468]CCB78418.1 DeoR family transcriptional regulator [Streptantibioticus cattleyicolor NRRL 8057 = DSM 46488]